MAPSASAFFLNLDRISKLRSCISGCVCDGVLFLVAYGMGVLFVVAYALFGYICDGCIVDSNYSSQRPRPCQVVVHQHVGGNHIVRLPYIIAQESSLYALKQDLMDPRCIVVMLRHLSNNNFRGAASCGML